MRKKASKVVRTRTKRKCIMRRSFETKTREETNGAIKRIAHIKARPLRLKIINHFLMIRISHQLVDHLLVLKFYTLSI